MRLSTLCSLVILTVVGPAFAITSAPGTMRESSFTLSGSLCVHLLAVMSGTLLLHVDERRSPHKGSSNPSTPPSQPVEDTSGTLSGSVSAVEDLARYW